jgi:DNA mismatch repair ATPase MutS
MILTGINGSGKTTILKTTALNIIFSQQFGCGFYETATIDVYTHIHSYLNIPDTSQRDSLYQAESRRCKEIIDIIGQVEENDNKKSRHFCIFDELFSGTAPESAIKSGTAFLSYLTKYNNVDFILTTHFIKICDKLKKNKRIRNFKTIVEKTDNDRICYTYKIEKGISRDEGAIYVLRDMDYPEEIISEFLE